MSDNDRFEMNGYSFDRDMGFEARKEAKAIEYLTKQLDMNVPETVMKVYKQIISQKLFHTQIGYDFLKGLQNYLYTNPNIDNSDIDTIEIDSAEESLKALNESRLKRGEAALKIGGTATAKGKKSSVNEDGKYKLRSKMFLVTTIVLLLTVISMFIITFTSKVPTILNYEKVLNDKYSLWEQELTERENDLRKKENDFIQEESEGNEQEDVAESNEENDTESSQTQE